MRRAISLRDFLQTGRLGPIELGMTRDAVAATLGPPDAEGALLRGVARIWRYGSIELHFDEDAVFAIHSDHGSLDAPDGGRAFDLDPWIISSALRRDTAVHELAAAGMPCTPVEEAWNPNTDGLRTPSGVSLLFEGEDHTSPSERRLVSMSLSARVRGGRGISAQSSRGDAPP